MKEQESKAKKIVAIVLFFALVGAMIAGAWYYSAVVLDDSNNSNTTSDGQSSKVKDLTATEEIETTIISGVEDIQQRTNADRSDLETIHQSTASANAIISGVDQSLLNGGDACAAIKAFDTASTKAIVAERKVMEKTFELLQNSLSARWNIEDLRIEAERKTAESSFLDLVTLYEKAVAKSSDSLEAIGEYQTNQLLALGTFYDDYNVAQASYRIDQLSVIETHYDSVRKVLDDFTAGINQAATEARQKCADAGAGLSLASEIIRIKKSFVESVSEENTESLSQATKLLETRNKEVSRVAETFLSRAHDLRLVLENTTPKQ